MSNVLLEMVRELQSGNLRVVDLTQPLGPETPIIQLPPPFTNTPTFKPRKLSQFDEDGPAWYWNSFETGEHTGTHFDAPAHWISGKDLPAGTVDKIPVQKFIGPACVIDSAAASAENPDFLLTPEHILDWETRHGKIPSGAWVLMRTDWSKREDPKEFLNVGEDGPHTPGWSPGCAELLAKERDVLGVGVETVGTDAGCAGSFDPPFANHHIMHGNGKFGLASLCNLDKLPPTGAVVIAAPLKIVAGSGSPLRVLAITP